MVFVYKYDISIVAGYYNRKSQLKNTLDYFEANYKNYNYETIIVDDNSTKEHQLDELVLNYSFPIKYIKISSEEKGDRINPCIVYNTGIKQAEGKRVIIQNPECIHVGNILNYVMMNLDYNDYIAFSCYNCSSHDLTQELLSNVSKINEHDFNRRNRLCWYNHPTIRPVHYHFCAAVFNDNLKILGGFNEEFAKGHSFDDNEILLSLKYNLKLNIKTIGPENGFVIHQWHARDAESKFSKAQFDRMLSHNQNLYYSYYNHHKKYSFNFPKLMHLYWDGSSLAYMNLLTILSFNKHNIGWKINVYFPIKRNTACSWVTNEQKTKYTGIDYSNELKKISNVNIHYIDTELLPFKHKDASEVIKSDYFRLYILNKFGGLWSDFDIIYTQSIENYYETCDISKIINMIVFSYFLKEKNRVYRVFPVGMFLANKHNSFLTSLLSKIDNYYNSSNYQCLGAIMFADIFSSGRRSSISNEININIDKNEVYIDNAECYLKVKWNQLDFLYKNDKITPELFEGLNKIVGVHWFNGADDSKHFCNNLNLGELKTKAPSNLMERFIQQYI